MTLKNGQPVTTQAQWQQRRAEIIEEFDREVLGRVPANAPKITWRIVYTDQEMLGRTPVTVKKLIGRADNSAYPDYQRRISR